MSRPLMLVLAYRQEAFIAEAVRAALSQIGPKLDIVISDDCSGDDTWSVIRQTVEGYTGPHTVRIVRNETNLGLIPHLNARLAEAEAQHVIVAAGDDVSEPNRAKRILETFERTGALLVHSRFSPIDQAGMPAPDPPRGKFETTTRLTSAARSLGLYVGATGAWDRSLFTKYGPISDGVHEDLVLGFRAALGQRIAFVDEPLVRYRVDIGLSAQAPKGLGEDEWRALRRKTLTRGMLTFEQRIKDARTFGLAANAPAMRILETKLREYRARIDVLGQPGSQIVLNRAFRTLRHFRAWRSERKREAGRF